MKKFISVLTLILLFGAGRSVAQDVRYNFAKDADFTKYKTYKWVSIKNASQVDEITAKQLTSAIDAGLAQKGLTKTDSDSADLFVAYQTAVGTEQQINVYQTGWGYGRGWGPGWYGGGGAYSTTASTSTLYVGSLDLDLYAAGSKELVWRGTASKTLDPKAKPEKRDKNIQKAVTKLLKNYPPKVKK